MILRKNYQDVQKHIEYRRSVNQDSQRTLQTRWSALKMLLLWADSKPLERAPDIRPTFPEFLARQRRDGRRLSHGGQETIISMARVFFTWAVAAHPRRYRRITRLWLDALRPARDHSGIKERQAYSLEDVRALLAVDDDRLATRRVKAAVAMLFLSGMRIGALVTLPIKAVDLEHRQIRQWTEMGVKTKFSKSATTYLLDIPDLMDVVRRWDALVRGALPAEAMWYANITGARRKRVEATTLQSHYRSRSLYRGLRELCNAAGIAYLSPHKLRHGHVMHALSHSSSPADWKAISQNVMHSNLATTDGIYGILKDPEVAERIARLGGTDEHKPTVSKAEILAQIKELMAQL